tara:strand:- start:108 stop:287 length:180 start_codon:yes stop_codon:yes gene_type:complete
MEARIYVGWPDGYFLVSGHDRFQECLAEMVEDLGPPTVVEFRAADEGYVELEDDDLGDV